MPPAIIATTRDGGTFAIPRSDGSVDLYDSSTPARTAVIPIDPGARVFSVTIAPDDRTIAATTPFGKVWFWDLRTRRPIAPPQTAHVGPVWTPTFSQDGRWMATSSTDNAVRLWDVRRHQPVATLQPGAFVDDVGLRPDGTTLAVTTGAERGQGSVEIYSVPRLNRITALAAPWGRWGRFSPDGRTLSTTSLDGTARLWELPSGRPIGQALPGPAGRRSAAVFVQGGTHLVTVHDDGRALLWDVRPSSWLARAFSVAGRTLTRNKWENALPGREYAPACHTR